ncbi:MAG: FAD-binding protein, partial [Flavobacteriaceae bacterium]
MSVLIYASSSDGKFKKSSFEVVSYGKKVAEELGTKLIALTINANDVTELQNYGADTIVSVNNEALNEFNAKEYAYVIQQVAESKESKVVVIDSSIDGIYVGPLVSVALNAGYASNVVDAPSSTSPFVVKRKAFSNKGFNNTEITTENKVIGLAKNSFGIHENPVTASVENLEVSVSEPGVKSISIDKAIGKVTIADADVVVSAGRGLKGPENWGMVEELADVLGAATACSKPVSDL